ncbi:MAG: hypothetical protein H6738_25335, partial [Alphaproteobacteria bacterium]|nr:hypothetical protein [Alphaproteobacteria bacterium]
MQADPRSLRYRVLVVVVAAVVLPLVWVWVAGSFAPRQERRTQAALEQALHDAVAHPDPDAMDAIARRYRVRLRTFDPSGRPGIDVDHAEPLSLLAPVADPLYGPEGAP